MTNNAAYELHPTTQFIATACCFCGKPLVDPASVERGYGPDCAERYGSFEGHGGPADWEKAVALVPQVGEAFAERVAEHVAARHEYMVARKALHHVALCTSRDIGDATVVAAIDLIAAVGYPHLSSIVAMSCVRHVEMGGAELAQVFQRAKAALAQGKDGDTAEQIEKRRLAAERKIAKKLNVQITITRDGDLLVVNSPYNRDSLPAWRALRARPYDSAREANIISATDNVALWGLFRRFYQGVGGVVKAADGTIERYFQVPAQGKAA